LALNLFDSIADQVRLILQMSEWNSIARHLVTAFIHCTAEYGLVLLAMDDVSGIDGESTLAKQITVETQ